MLKDDYEYNVLRPVYEKYPIADIEDEYPIEKPSHDYENENEDDNMVELLYVTDEYASEGNVDETLITNDIEPTPNTRITSAPSEDENLSVQPETSYTETRTRNDIKLIKGIDEKSGEPTYILPDFDEDDAKHIKAEQSDLIVDNSTDDINDVQQPITPTVILNQRQTRSGRFAKPESKIQQQSSSQKQKTAATNKGKKLHPANEKENARIVLLNESLGSQSKKVQSNATNRKRSATNSTSKQKASPKVKKTSKTKTSTNDCDEGESDDEFPARDSDNEDWPAQETLNTFPKELIKNGLLLVKGKDLMSIINK